jgi:hypothetical protein
MLGDFTDEADGDKSVSYAFSNPYTGVFFEQKLMPLLDALGIVEERVNAAAANATASAFKSINKRRKSKYSVADSVLGHVIAIDDSGNEITIHPVSDTPESMRRYFIPHEPKDSTDWGPGRLGSITVTLFFNSSVFCAAHLTYHNDFH